MGEWWMRVGGEGGDRERPSQRKMVSNVSSSRSKPPTLPAKPHAPALHACSHFGDPLQRANGNMGQSGGSAPNEPPGSGGAFSELVVEVLLSAVLPAVERAAIRYHEAAGNDKPAVPQIFLLLRLLSLPLALCARANNPHSHHSLVRPASNYPLIHIAHMAPTNLVVVAALGPRRTFACSAAAVQRQ